MTRKQKRGTVVAAGVGLLGLAAVLVLFALKDTVTYFHTPSDIADKKVAPGSRFRLGGLVAVASIKRGTGTQVEFAVTDTLKTVPVLFNGILPDLFREGQGVVTEGRLDTAGHFIADTVLAKHDETYMPPDVAKALKEKGVKLGDKATHPGDAPPASPKTGG